jgi:hypothetical protein
MLESMAVSKVRGGGDIPPQACTGVKACTIGTLLWVYTPALLGTEQKVHTWARNQAKPSRLNLEYDVRGTADTLTAILSIAATCLCSVSLQYNARTASGTQH